MQSYKDSISKYELYKYYGCHWTSKGFVFRVYAPNALSVAVIGDFNNWSEHRHIMNSLGDGNFEIVIPSAMELDQYKYLINTENGKLYKADPFAYYNDLGDYKNSRVFSIDEFKWQDRSYMKNRGYYNNKPMNIYEVHLGSWKRHEDGSYYTYKEYAIELVDYVKQMGYTHIELMPITEYPYDGSWGYQVTGYFAVTARYGEPYDFMEFVNLAHRAGIGVIIDWVPAHFNKDDHGLYEFDGSLLYENSDPLRKEHEEWGTRIFDYGKEYVQNFLISSAMFYFDNYHIDGIRVDAVASMIYLDYGKKEWKANKYGTNINLEAVDFLKQLNVVVHGKYPSIVMIAEESTSYPKVTCPVCYDGLGFDYKWNMGWMNDTLNYMQSNMRWGCHHNMSFSMMYAYNEHFVLPLSHDEVVHGKKSLLSKMPGEYDEKFANLRAYYGYMMTHPGKKLTFMGAEIAQFIEWDYKNGLDWLLLKYPRHKEMKKYFADLNKFYLKHSELWELDDDYTGFEWIKEDDGHEGYVYKRFNKNRDELLVIVNFNTHGDDDYKINTPYNYKEVFNSDKCQYGGTGVVNNNVVNVEGCITLRLAPLAIVILQIVKEGE